MAPLAAHRMPMFPPGVPGIGQQLIYGQAPPTIISPQAGFGYHQLLMPGMRHGMPTFMMPMVQQGQQGPRPGGRRGLGPASQQTQQQIPLMQHQMLPRGCLYRYPPGRNMQDGPMSGDTGGLLPVTYDMAIMRDAPVPMPVPALATALANAPPEHQRTMLGENLYPLVDQLEHEAAAKVTCRLLEMDQTEVFHLLESPEALKAKVEEAMEVLKNVATQQNSPTDQLASLSLNVHLAS